MESDSKSEWGTVEESQSSPDVGTRDMTRTRL